MSLYFSCSPDDLLWTSPLTPFPVGWDGNGVTCTSPELRSRSGVRWGTCNKTSEWKRKIQSDSQWPHSLQKKDPLYLAPFKICYCSVTINYAIYIFIHPVLASQAHGCASPRSVYELITVNCNLENCKSAIKWHRVIQQCCVKSWVLSTDTGRPTNWRTKFGCAQLAYTVPDKVRKDDVVVVLGRYNRVLWKNVVGLCPTRKRVRLNSVSG